MNPLSSKITKTTLTLLIAGAFVVGMTLSGINLPDADAVKIVPIKRIQVKTTDPLGDPFPEITCVYVYDIINTLTRTTDDRGVDNFKLIPLPVDFEIKVDCEKEGLFFDGIIEINPDKILTKADLMLCPPPLVPNGDGTACVPP